MARRNPTPPLVLASMTVALVAFVLYVSLEVTARFNNVVDKDIADRIAAAADPARDLPSLARHTSVTYGWDQEPVEIPESGGDEANGVDLLTLGDSVTRGFGVEEPDLRSFPALLQHALSTERDIRVVNGAVPGFGIDQMVLKLDAELAKRKPRLVIVAYIPTDLHRSGRDYNFGITKPVLSSYANGAWRMRSASNLFEFYRGYLAARSQLRLGPWWLGFLAENRQYYLPAIDRSRYETRFRGIRENLRDLAAAHDVPIILARLPNGHLGGTIAVLDEWATRAFSSGGDNVRFVDVESCAKMHAGDEGLDLDADFSGHPDARAHAIFARCLLPFVEEELATRAELRPTL